MRFYSSFNVPSAELSETRHMESLFRLSQDDLCHGYKHQVVASDHKKHLGKAEIFGCNGLALPGQLHEGYHVGQG